MKYHHKPFRFPPLIILGALLALSSCTSGISNSGPPELLHKMKLDSAFPKSVAWSPNSKLVAVGGSLPGVQIWDVAAEHSTGVLPGPGTEQGGLAWSPLGNLVATASVHPTTTLYIWDIASKHLDFSAGPQGGVSSVAWSPNGKMLAVAVGGEIADSTGEVHNSKVSIYDSSTWQLHSSVPYTLFVGPVSWAPDNVQLAFGTNSADLGYGTVLIWNTRSGEISQTLIEHHGDISSVTWSPDGAFLATASSDRTIKIWSVATQQEYATFVNNDRINSVTWSPDNRRLASAGDDGTVRVWDIINKGLLKTFAHDNAFVKDVSWSPDGSSLASVSFSDYLWIWDVR